MNIGLARIRTPIHYESMRVSFDQQCLLVSKQGTLVFSCGMPAAMHEPQATQQRESYLSYSGWGNPIWRLPKKRNGIHVKRMCK